jgi:hypothetical protein
VTLLLGLVLGAQETPAPKPVPVDCDASALPPLTLHQRILDYQTSLFSWERLGISAVSAGYGQWRDRPIDWPQGARGYGMRLGDSFGRHAIRQTVSFAVAGALRDDPRYRPLHDGSMAARTLWALHWTVLTRSASGRAVPNLPLFVSSYSTEFIANSWYPATMSDPRNAARRGSYVLLGAFAFNLWREFAPSRLLGRH